MSNSSELTESDLSRLFARYPNINFDVATEVAAESIVGEHFSSPSSNDTDEDGTRTTDEAVSTAHTTPLRPSPRSTGPSDFPSMDDFLQKVESADLPVSSKAAFCGLAREMQDLGAILLLGESHRLGSSIDADKPKILWQSRLILDRLQESNCNIREQVDNIAFIKSRGPFTIEPSDQDLWCNYRQRAMLIAEYTALPCRTEKTVVEDLSHIFDAYVYHPFLRLLQIEEVDVDVQAWINMLYDATMTLLNNYNLWWKGMREIRQNYMLPLMRRIRRSPDTLREIAEAEQATSAAKAMIASEVPGTRPPDERIIQELNLKAVPRRMALPSRTRYR